MNRSRLVAVVLVLASLALALALGWQAQRAGATADARDDALAAARTRVPLLLSYEADSLHQDLDRAVQQTTGDFADDYRTMLDDVVRSTAERRGISTTASVSAAGVVSGDRDQVVVLVFLTQTTTAKGDRSSVSGSRVKVTMRRSGAAWKVAGLDPV